MLKKPFFILFTFLFGVLHSQTEVKLTEKQKAEVIEDICRLLLDHYVFPDTAAKYASYLKQQLKTSAYKHVQDPVRFSDLINKDLASVHKDGHLQMQYDPAFSEQLLHPAEEPPTQEDPFKFRPETSGLSKIEILNGKIGYLNLARFNADDAEGKATIKAAFKILNNSNALIIDLRSCSGGSPRTVSLICGYFLKERTHLNDSYNRSTHTTIEYWTTPDTSLKKLFNIPLYILTSDKTFSASEELCYDLQILKRAIIVGERTGGGAHNTFERSVVHGFVIYIPYGRMIHPITKSNWEGAGIKPDIEVPASKALVAVETAIFKNLLALARSDRESYELNWQYELLKAMNDPVVLDSLTLKKYAGVYGQRTFTLEHGKLYYQRTGKPKFELEPMTRTIMKGKNNDYFRIEFIANENGEVNEVKAYYQDYRTESSRREGK